MEGILAVEPDPKYTVTIVTDPPADGLVLPAEFHSVLGQPGRYEGSYCCGSYVHVVPTSPCFALSGPEITIASIQHTPNPYTFLTTAKPNLVVHGKVRKHSDQSDFPGVHINGVLDPNEITQSNGEFWASIPCGQPASISPQYSDATGSWKFSPGSYSDANPIQNMDHLDFDAFPPDTWNEVLSLNSFEFHRSSDQVILSWQVNYSSTSTDLYLVEDNPKRSSGGRCTTSRTGRIEPPPRSSRRGNTRVS
jgi:hypothetical protein